MEGKAYLRISGNRPKNFRGSLWLPPSKSYLHRALYAAALASGTSRIFNSGTIFPDDVEATVRAISSHGFKIERKKEKKGALIVSDGKIAGAAKPVFVGASGTTARFEISFAALAEDAGHTKITGDSSLSKRPMQPLLDALAQLGVDCFSENHDGRLPVVIKGGGISGGRCRVDGSISSQFVSSLLISCTRAKKDCRIEFLNPSSIVSKPYIDSTLVVLTHYGFKIEARHSKKREYLGFFVRGNQSPRGSDFTVPGDMSSAASLIGAAIAARGRLTLSGINRKFPQSDEIFIKIARRLGALLTFRSKGTLVVDARKMRPNPRNSIPLHFDLKDAPDLVPVVAAVSAAIGRNIDLTGIAHLRFKESDRIGTLSREMSKLVLDTKKGDSALQVRANPQSFRLGGPVFLESEKDHRILMALAIAGISGRFGELMISDPDCVRKSYPAFVSDLQSLCHDRTVLNIVKMEPSQTIRLQKKKLGVAS